MDDGMQGQPVELTIEGLEVFAHHGLLDEERELGQTFLFDLYLLVDDCPACDSDDITQTVDYAAVADAVVAAATGETYNLIEKLASAVAGELLEGFPALGQVGIRIAKPAAPMPYPVESVAVYLERSRETMA